MRPSALILSVGLAAVVSFSCAPPPQAETGPRPAIAAACDVNTFLGRVHYLQVTTPPFNPQAKGAGYQSPQPDLTPVSGTIQQELTAAFSAAPDFFQKQLCGLTGIYIDTTGCTDHDPNTCRLSDGELLQYSWGFREQPSQSANAGRYIATSLALWKMGGRTPQFLEYRTRRLKVLLNKLAGPNAPNDTNAPRYISTNTDTSAMTVLTALAHEFSHVFWYDTFVPVPGGVADLGRFCGGTFYSGSGGGQGSWADPVQLPPNRWVEFGEMLNRHKAGGIDMAQLRSDLRQGHFRHAGDLLHDLYSGGPPKGQNPQNGRWASALAAMSPDEDFVETYQLYVLMSASPQLTSLRIQIPGTGATHSNNIPDTLRRHPQQKKELVRKMSCFGPLPFKAP